MIFFGRRHDPHADAIAEATEDAVVAKEERAQAEESLSATKNRWATVRQVVRLSRDIRRENHLASSIIELFRSHP